jgi:predicted RNase H-like HicB family nuclease
MRQYIGLIHKDSDSDFGVSFPDFPGAVTAGKTLDDARALAEQMLSFHVEGMLEDGEPIPEPSSLEAIMSQAEQRDGVAILVPVRTADEKAVRLNVTLPADLLDRIDRHARRAGLSRSAFLAKAAREAIKTEDADLRV